jgi:glycosyltransferase involved in cell wall biosynthesis
MKVLIYAHSFAPRVGGAETYIMMLAKGLGVRVQAGGKRTDALGGDAVDAVTVATPTPADGFDDHALPFRVVRQPRLLRLWRLIGEANVVHLAGPVLAPLALALLRRKPVIVEHHGYQAICPNGLLLEEPEKTVCSGHFMARRYRACLRCNVAGVGWRRGVTRLALTVPRRWLCKRATAHVGVSDHVSKRIALPRSRTIYHGVPDGVANAREPANLGGTAPAFAYVGRLVSEKGLLLLLEAAKRLRDGGCDFRLKLVGDGPELPRLEALVERLGLRDRVTLTGLLRGAMLDEALHDVTAVVMPSIWEETAGLAAIEHMMRGRLVIAADIGGLAEVVDDAGLKFQARDVAGLTLCLRLALDQPDLVRRLGTRARSRALKVFCWSRMVEEHLALYQTLSTAPSARGPARSTDADRPVPSRLS